MSIFLVMSWYNLTRKLHDKQLEASFYYVCSWCRKDKLQKGYFFLHLSENNSRSFKLHCIHSCYLYNVLSTQPNTRTTKGAKTVKCFILRNGSMALFIPFSCYWNMIKRSSSNFYWQQKILFQEIIHTNEWTCRTSES